MTTGAGRGCSGPGPGRFLLMRRVIVPAALCVLMVAVACGTDDDAAVDDDPPDTTTTTTTTTTIAPTTTTTTTAPDEDDEPVAVSVYFMDGEQLRVGWVRQVEPPAVAEGALLDLLEGVNADEQDLGMTSAIPEGTELLGVAVEGDVATVDLSGEFAEGGGTLSMNARLAQVVYTVTQFPTVEAMRLHLDGEPATALGGEGLMVDRLLTREDFEFQGDMEHLAPPILVETPRPGEQVDPSLRVAGSSNTFEAALYLEVIDDDGEVLVEETFVMATAGTGTRGTFDATVEVPPGSGPITLLAYEISARDGSRVGIVEVPLQVGG
jgi:germination protein M